MSEISEIIKKSRKIVVKIGSNVISDDGMVNRERLHNIVDQVKYLMDMGKQVVIVSSGAGACGVGVLNKWGRRGDINYKQALCAIGQVELMMAYKEYFGDYDIHVGQILLTGEDFGDHNRTLHIRNTLFTLIDEGIVPVINENDSVCVDEINSIGDNDTLSALTANLWSADALIIMSDIDGVFDKDPKTHADAKLITKITNIDDTMKHIDTSGKSTFGTGGIVCKINAARSVNELGSDMILLNGKKKDIMISALEGAESGTLFACE